MSLPKTFFAFAVCFLIAGIAGQTTVEVIDTPVPEAPASETVVATSEDTPAPGGPTTTAGATTTAAATSPAPTSVPLTPAPPGCGSCGAECCQYCRNRVSCNAFGPTIGCAWTGAALLEGTCEAGSIVPTAAPTPLPPGQTTPAPPQTVVTVVFSGNEWATIVNNATKKAQFQNGLKKDIASALGVPQSSVTILSITVGSLHVEFLVNNVEPATVSEILQSAPAAYFSNVQEVYQTETGGATDFAVESVAASNPPEPQQKFCDKSCIAGAVIGGFAGLLLLGLVMYFIYVRSSKGTGSAEPVANSGASV